MFLTRAATQINPVMDLAPVYQVGKQFLLSSAQRGDSYRRLSLPQLKWKWVLTVTRTCMLQVEINKQRSINHATRISSHTTCNFQIVLGFIQHSQQIRNTLQQMAQTLFYRLLLWSSIAQHVNGNIANKLHIRSHSKAICGNCKRSTVPEN
jgi:hypothetical protein